MKKCTQEINHHTSMESKPKRWMIQPLSQRLEPTDACPMRSCTANDLLRRDQSCSYSESSNSTTFSYDILSFTCTQFLDIVSSQRKEVPRDAMVQAKQEAVLDEVDNANNDWHPSSPSSHGSPNSNKGSHYGFYSFVEDPSSPEAELNKTWMVSQERKTKLVTLKNVDSFKLQTYSSGRKPQSLFDENNGDSRYQVNDNGVQNVNKHDEKQLRQQIIYTQAPKQNFTFKEQWSVLDNLNLSNSPNGITEDSNRNSLLQHLLVDSRGGDTGDESLYSDNLQLKGRDTQSTSGHTETPIQREIFITQEREWCSQGIKHNAVNVKVAEIKTKSSQPKPLFTSVKKAKPKNKLHFLIQQEIKKSDWEEDLLNQENDLDLYDHGASQDLEEKKRIFEQVQHFDTAEEKNLSIYHTTKEHFWVKVRQRSGSSDTRNVFNPEETEFYTHKSSTPDKQEEPIHHESPSFLVEQTNKMTVSKYYSPTILVSKFDKTKSFYPCNHPTARPSCFCIVTAQPWSSQHPSLPVYAGIQPIDDVNNEVSESSSLPWNPAMEDLEEIKKSLDFLSGETSAIRLQQKSILDLVEEVKALRLLNEEKDKRIAVLENRVADLEQYTRMNDVITGLRVKPRSFASAVAGPGPTGEPSPGMTDSTEEQVASFLLSKGIRLDCDTVEACHPLPRRSNNDKPVIIMRFSNRRQIICSPKTGQVV
ncbi:uncharacterized protein LOC124487346 isoform X2 [Hypomesus transpacificus]|uniref:uncharacterized protein LOC124487346 isoform X2 n=1 Tax=Hypomesus transpacificus TaxID=137520 RepID=UPI001F082419|nr:uncharacterized protein LOC124487346 isoform X2 [Hypomesus transpacificus]